MKKRLVTVVLLLMLLVGFVGGAGIRANLIQVGALEARNFSAEAEGESQTMQKYNAKSALLMDYNTGKVLFEQDAHKKLPIASMVKIMTLLVIFDDLNAGKFALDTDVVISQNAASMGGSQAFLDANSVYKADELIKSIIVASANDSCVAMAEFLSGDVSSFVERMNGKAQELGLENTYYVNCTGLSAPNQYSSAHDVAMMTRELIKTPLFFTHAKVWMFDFAHPGGRVTGLTNTNKLVRFYEGCDGGKTGFTSEALSCLSATAKRGDTRLISVVIGAPSSKVRNGEVSKMLSYGFANYSTKQIVFRDVNLLENVPVSGGKPNAITVAPKDDYFVLTKKGGAANYTIEHELDVLKAPIQSGGVVGKLIIKIEGQDTVEIPLISQTDIKKSGYLDVIDGLIDKWN